MNPFSSHVGNEKRLFLELTGDHQQKKYQFKVKMNPKNLQAHGWLGDKNNKLAVHLDASLTSQKAQEIFKTCVASSPKLRLMFRSVNGNNHEEPFLCYSDKAGEAPKAELYLKGKYAEGKFRVLLRLDHPAESIASIKKTGQKVYVPAGKVQGDFAAQNASRIMQALEDYHTQLQVAINPQGTLVLNLSSPAPQFSHAAGAPLKGAAKLGFQIPNVDASTHAAQKAAEKQKPLQQGDNPPLMNSKELAYRMKTERNQPDLQNIAKEMVKLFGSQGAPFAPEIQEITPLPYVVEPDVHRVIMTKLSSYLGKALDNPPVLEALSDIFDEFQEANFQAAYHAAKKNPHQKPAYLVIDNPFDKLDIAELVSLASALQPKLKTVPPQDKEIVKRYFKAMVALLNAMVSKEVDQLRKETQYDPYYEAISDDKFTSHADLEIAYLARVAVQELALIKNDETTQKSFLRRSWHVAKGLAVIADAIDPKQPWKALKAIEAIPEFAEAFDFHTGKKKWYGHLCVLRQRFRIRPEELIWAIALKTDDEEVWKTLEWDNPIFVRGFIDILWELLSQPTLDPNVGNSAIDVLEKLWHVNQDNGKKHRFRNLFSHQETHYKKPLCDHITQLLLNCTLHSSPSIQKRANLSIETLKAEKAALPKFAIPFDSQHFPNALFLKALASAAPTHTALKYVVKYLQNDDQVKRDQDLFVAPEVKEQLTSPPEPFKGHWEAFKKSGKRAMVIQAEPGYGKSLLAKLLALWRAQEYSKTEPPIFYFPLQRFQDPSTHLITEGLRRYGINSEEQLSKLESEEFICACDAFDERYFDGDKPKLLLTNIDELNRFSKARFVFLYRRNFVNPSYFDPPPGQGSAVKLLLAPFRKEKLYFYAWNYLQALQKNNRKSEWPIDQFVKALDVLCEFEMTTGNGHLEKTKVISNPFYLAITIELLPFILKS